jgi:DNA-binding PadR family transcriptional regulator
LTTDDDAAAGSGRRSRIVYKLTADGKERLQEQLSEGGPSAWDDDSFGVRFAFFAQTDADVRLKILEGRRSRLEERREKVTSAVGRTREKLDRYTLELQRHGLESVEREVRWLNELIATERAGVAARPRRSAATTHDN